MNLCFLLLVQSAFGGSLADKPLPRFSDPGQMEVREVYPWIGIEPMAVYTGFESGLHLDNAWGFGADAFVTLDYGTGAFLGFKMGALGWNTRTDSSAGIPSQGVEVRQYRVGVYGQFPFRFLEVGIGANTGGYRFRRDGQDDTAGFFEFEAMLGARPAPYVWAGIVAMQTFTSTNFNHSSDHFYINYSIGPAVELRF